MRNIHFQFRFNNITTHLNHDTFIHHNLVYHWLSECPAFAVLESRQCLKRLELYNNIVMTNEVSPTFQSVMPFVTI